MESVYFIDQNSKLQTGLKQGRYKRYRPETECADDMYLDKANLCAEFQTCPLKGVYFTDQNGNLQTGL